MPPVLKFEDLTDDDCEGMCDVDGILIEKTLRNHYDFMTQTLLHEMIHWKLRDFEHLESDSHGPLFKQEVYKLWNMNAYEGLL